ncbi:MAG: TetR/AcrR family transcriptional regulator [Myxococcota bacterium]
MPTASSSPKRKSPRARKGPGRPAGSGSGEGRAALLRAARDLMAEKGLPHVTLREVADRAGVKPALVHYYFEGKRGLLDAVIAEVGGRALARMQQAIQSEGTPEQRLRAYIEGWVAGIAEDPYFPRLAAEHVLFSEDDVIDDFVERFVRPNLEMLRSLLDEGAASGAFREVDPRFLIPNIAGACLWFFLAAPLVRRVFDLDEITPEIVGQFAQSTSTLVLRGIAGPGAVATEPSPTR